MSLISAGYTRKKNIIKQKNKSLYHFFIILGLLISPILILFVPLPGALIIEAKSPFSVLIGISFFTILGGIESIVYWNTWTKKELLFFQLLTSKGLLIRDHFKCFIEKHIFYHVVVLSAFIRVEPSYKWTVYLIILYILIFFVFTVTYFTYKNYKVKSFNISNSELKIIWKLSSLYITGEILLKYFLILIVSSLSVIFQNNITDKSVMIYFSLLFFIVSFFLLHSIFKALKFNIARYKSMNFLISKLMFSHIIKINLVLFFYIISDVSIFKF
jgi:hypothetical protein